jgi:hypothetical protein
MYNLFVNFVKTAMIMLISKATQKNIHNWVDVTILVPTINKLNLPPCVKLVTTPWIHFYTHGQVTIEAWKKDC